MNKLYAIYVILSAKDNDTYIVSTKPKDLVLPCEQITVPHKVQQESRFILKNFFVENTYKYSEECSYNFLDIQEENTLDYVKEINQQYNEEDLYLTYGGISLMNNLKSNWYWYKLVFNTEYYGYTTNKSLNLLIDNVINKTTL